MLRSILFLVLAMGSFGSVRAAVVRVADGDCAGLSNAVTAAQTATGTTTVILARGGNYPSCGINMNAGSVVIEGQGSQLPFFSACIGSVNNRTPSASLLIRNLSIGAPDANASGLSLCPIPTGDIGIATLYFPIINTGSLTFESVALQLPSTGPAFVASYGNLVLRNVSVENIKTALIDNAGNLEIYNSTFARDGQDARTLIYPSAWGGSRGTAQIANSLFTGFALPACSKYDAADVTSFKSLGGNVASEDSCGLSANAGDKIVLDAGLGSFGNHGGLISTQALAYTSPARGAGVTQYCEALDARGYTRSAKGCDAGAYEYGGGSGALSANGMNGFYYDRDAGGHYVSIQRIHDNGDVAIVWSAFDANGNQAWIYGVGQVSGKHIHAAMSQNIGGVLQPGGPPSGSSVRPWGTVDIDLASCALAQFNYASTLDGFGSGQFPLTRLAYVSDFGCAE